MRKERERSERDGEGVRERKKERDVYWGKNSFCFCLKIVFMSSFFNFESNF